MAFFKHFLFILTFLVLIGLAYSTTQSTLISNEIFEPRKSTGRALLQTKTECPINFENKNYTVITANCKPPLYPKKECCEAFKRFACPFVNTLNSKKYVCPSVMFSYINLYGKYPSGLFSSYCVEGTRGLLCPKEEAKVNVTKEEAKVKVKKKSGSEKAMTLSKMMQIS
ncbi:GPI-anchored protein LLG1, partial [Fagus crenata]